MFVTNVKDHTFKLDKNVSGKEAFEKEESLDFTKDDLKFGFACAAAQIEDGLNDIWLRHAKAGKVAGFEADDPKNIRNNFWTNPDDELQYVFDTNVEVFRISLDWERICPDGKNFSIDAINGYRNILKKVKAKGIETMVTLYHHSEPTWSHDNGSWANNLIVGQFCEYAEFVAKELGDIVDYWNTFNEVQMYITLTQLSGFWPAPKNKISPLGLFDIGPIKGCFTKSIENVAKAHNRSYSLIKNHSRAPISIAHNLAYFIGEDFLGTIGAKISWKKFNFLLIDLIKENLDFLGINYYGAELLRGFKLNLSERFEYSDSGRAIYPKGFYEMIKIFYQKYNKPIFITENGMSDAVDTMREKYMVEHLKAVKMAMLEGVPIMGYIWWSMTDNLEWADGYAPKFGLVEVKREGDKIIRKKRKSYELYKKIVQERVLSSNHLDEIEDNYKSVIGKERAMSRGEDAQTALSDFRYQKVKDIDWGI